MSADELAASSGETGITDSTTMAHRSESVPTAASVIESTTTGYTGSFPEIAETTNPTQSSGATIEMPVSSVAATERPQKSQKKRNHEKREILKSTRHRGQAETPFSILHHDEIQELFFKQMEVVEEHLANTEFSEHNYRLIRECIDGGAQTNLWMSSNEHEQAKILEKLREHYTGGRVEIGLTVEEDLQSLRIFRKPELHKALDNITKEHRAKFKVAIKNAGADLTGAYQLDSSHNDPRNSKFHHTAYKRCEGARKAVAEQSNISPPSLSQEDLEDLKNLAMARVQKTTTQIKESDISGEAKWALLNHNTYTRFWTMFYHGDHIYQQSMIQSLRQEFPQTQFRSEPLPKASHTVPESQLHSDGEISFSFDHLEAVTLAIEAGGGNWMASLATRTRKPGYGKASVDGEPAVGFEKIATNLRDAGVKNSVGDPHAVDTIVPTAVAPASDTEAEQQVGKNHKANRKKAEAKKQKKRAKATSEDQQSTAPGLGQASNSEGFTGPMFDGRYHFDTRTPERCEQGRMLMAGLSNAAASSFKAQEMDEMRVLVMGRVEKNIQIIQAAVISDDAKWVLLRFNEYTRLWSKFYPRDTDSSGNSKPSAAIKQRALCQRLRNSMGKDSFLPGSTAYQNFALGPNVQQMYEANFDRLEQILLAIEIGEATWVSKLPMGLR